MPNKSCFDYALAHISKYPKTVADLRRFLLKKEYDENVVEETIERLINSGRLDDAVYTRLTLASEVCRKGKPIYAIVQKLLLKGVDREVIEHERESVEDEIQAGMRERVSLLIQRLEARGYEQRKIIQNIAGKGYPYDLIKDVLSD